MNADALKRLICAISNGSREDLDRLRADWAGVSETFVGFFALRVVKASQNAAKSVVPANPKIVEEQHLRKALAEAQR